MIDDEGYRLNVGLVIANHNNELLWAKRADIGAWQFPQGGIDEGETLEQALYRELFEELGLKENHVILLAESSDWFKYKTDGIIKRQDESKNFIGQTQKWFLLRLEADDSVINLSTQATPEFLSFRWVSYWYPLKEIVVFKKAVYKKVLQEFASYLNLTKDETC